MILCGKHLFLLDYGNYYHKIREAYFSHNFRYENAKVLSNIEVVADEKNENKKGKKKRSNIISPQVVLEKHREALSLYKEVLQSYQSKK